MQQEKKVDWLALPYIGGLVRSRSSVGKLVKNELNCCAAAGAQFLCVA